MLCLGYDIYLAYNYVKECEKRVANSEKLIANMTAQKTEMLKMKAEIDLMTYYTNGVSIEL